MENGRPIEVFIIEDNEVYREALELMLAAVPDLQVIGSAGDGRSAVEACVERCPDVVLMDYRLPEMDGVETTAALLEACDVAVVALTATAEPAELEALLDAGALAWLTKDSDVTEIVGAIRDAAARGASLV